MPMSKSDWRAYIESGEIPRSIDSQGLIHSRQDILDMDLPAIQQICGPLHSASVTMMAGAAGVGKSLFALHMSNHIAAGENFESWKVPLPRRVLYVDGEMAPQYMQARIGTLKPPGPNETDWLNIIHLGSMADTNNFVDLSKPDWRNFFLDESVLDVWDVFVFDTVSSLIMPTEDIPVFSPEFWLQLEPFHQKFRAAGKTVVWVDNLNKEGTVYGTSVKHHKVDALWQLNNWEGKPKGATAGFKIESGKNRGGHEEPEGIWHFASDKQWTWMP